MRGSSCIPAPAISTAPSSTRSSPIAGRASQASAAWRARASCIASTRTRAASSSSPRPTRPIARSSEQFADHGREGELERGYLALVWGAPPRPHGTIDAPIGRHKTSRTKMAIVPVARGGREAVTHYQVVATFGHGPEPIASLLECTLGDRADPSGARASCLDRHARLSAIRSTARASSPSSASFPSRCRRSSPASTARRCTPHQLSFVHPVVGHLTGI